MTLRAPIGESYLQHVCKHFKSWPACQPQPVPTGSVDVPGKSASVRPWARARIKSRIPNVSSDYSLGLNSSPGREAAMQNVPSADVNAQDRDTHVPRLDRPWKPANRCCAIISRHPGVTASRSQATQRPTGAGASWQARPCRHAALAGHWDGLPLTMPVPGLRRGRRVSERPAMSSTDSTPANDVHPNVQSRTFWHPLATCNHADCLVIGHLRELTRQSAGVVGTM